VVGGGGLYFAFLPPQKTEGGLIATIKGTEKCTKCP
jgi:hypothetical protein